MQHIQTEYDISKLKNVEICKKSIYQINLD